MQIRSFKWSRILPVFILLLIFAYYLPALLIDFGYSDDYHALVFQRIEPNWTATAAENGRPMQGWLLKIMFGWAYDIAGLSSIRWVATTILFFISALLYKEFRILFGKDDHSAACFALLPVTLPSFEIITLWPSAFPAIASILFSLLGGILLLSSHRSFFVRSTCIGAGSVLIFLSLTTYQAGTAACLIPWLVRSPRYSSFIHGIKQLAQPFLAFVAVNGMYAFWLKQIQSSQVTLSGRTALVTDYGDKLVWFAEQPLKFSFATFATLESDGVRKLFIILQAVVVLSGLVFYTLRNKQNKQPLMILLWILAFPMAYYTGLLAAENWPSYRTQSVMSLVAIFFLSLSVQQIPLLSIRKAVSLFLVLVFMGFGGYHIYHDFVLLQRHDLVQLKEDLVALHQKEAPLKTAEKIYLVRPERIIGWNKGFIKQFGVDETGIPSSAVEWSTSAMVQLTLEDLGLPYSDSTYIFLQAGDTTKIEGKKNVIRLDHNFDTY